MLESETYKYKMQIKPGSGPTLEMAFWNAEGKLAQLPLMMPKLVHSPANSQSVQM